MFLWKRCLERIEQILCLSMKVTGNFVHCLLCWVCTPISCFYVSKKRETRLYNNLRIEEQFVLSCWAKLWSDPGWGIYMHLHCTHIMGKPSNLRFTVHVHLTCTLIIGSLITYMGLEALLHIRWNAMSLHVKTMR